MDNFENGLGKNRKFGLNKEDGPDKRAIDINLVLKKLETQLKNKPNDEILAKCQSVLDRLADKYEGKCTNKQISRMYKIQGKIFKYSGEKKLAKKYKYQAQESCKNHSLRRALLIVFLVVFAIAAISCFVIEQGAQEQRVVSNLSKCLEKASVSAQFGDGDEKELSIKCYKENKTNDAEEKIKELQEMIKEEQKNKREEEYMRQQAQENEKVVNCNTVYSGYSAYASCY